MPLSRVAVPSLLLAILHLLPVHAAHAVIGQPRFQLTSPKPAAASTAMGDVLTLDAAIRRGLAGNRQIQVARLTLQGAELAYKKAWDTMFVPQASLSATTGSAYSLTTLPSPNATETVRDHGYPTSAISLNLGTYTLFNFWRDWLVYEQSSLEWKRASEIYNESVRGVRFVIVNAYFRLKAEQEKLDAAARSVQISDAILELVKSRVRRKQSTESDVSSSSVDLLEAKTRYADQESNERNALWQLNQLLGDPVGTPYQIKETVRYAPVTLTLSQALKIYWEQAPTVKTGKKSLRQAELGLELAEKNQLPLPTVTFNGVTFSYQNTYYGGSYAPYGQEAGNTNVGVSAAVSLTLPLYGPDGFFNHRLVSQAQVSRDLADMNYQDATNRDVVSVYSAFAGFKQLEKTISNERQIFEQSTNVLDAVFARLSSGTVSRLELRDVLSTARASELSLLDANISYLSSKLALAQLIGVDSLPGDIY